MREAPNRSLMPNPFRIVLHPGSRVNIGFGTAHIKDKRKWHSRRYYSATSNST
jgi:hypothetical protein